MSIIGKTSCKLSRPHGSTHSHSYSVQRGYGFQIFMRSSTNADVYYIIIEEYLHPAIIAAQDVIKKKGVSNLILYDKIMKIENVHFSYYKKMYLLNDSLQIRNIIVHFNICITDTNFLCDTAFFGRKRNEKLE